MPYGDYQRLIKVMRDGVPPPWIHDTNTLIAMVYCLLYNKDRAKHEPALYPEQVYPRGCSDPDRRSREAERNQRVIMVRGAIGNTGNADGITIKGGGDAKT